MTLSPEVALREVRALAKHATDGCDENCTLDFGAPGNGSAALQIAINRLARAAFEHGVAVGSLQEYLEPGSYREPSWLPPAEKEEE